jgi:hypothetical protein
MPPVAEMDAPPADRVLVSQPDTSVLFMSRRSSLRLVKKAIRPVRGAEGQQVDVTQGETIQFVDGVLRLPREGRVMLQNGDSIDAGDALGWVEGHKLMGDWQEGFWRVDPTAPPLSKVELDALMDLAVNLDADGLRDLIAQEEAGWGRADLLESARGTLVRVEATLARVTAEREAALEQARADGAAAAKPASAAKPGVKAS